jgi:hypothetical protein
MTLASKAATASRQRGLLLAAHRAFRTHINSRCGQLKGESSAAGIHLNKNPDSITARNKLHLALQQIVDLKEGLTAFGPPASVPESDFSEYIALKRNTLMTAYTEALQGVRRASLPLLLAEVNSQEYSHCAMTLARATGQELACKEMLDRFDETFTVTGRHLTGA